MLVSALTDRQDVLLVADDERSHAALRVDRSHPPQGVDSDTDHTSPKFITDFHSLLNAASRPAHAVSRSLPAMPTTTIDGQRDLFPSAIRPQCRGRGMKPVRRTRTADGELDI